MQCDKKNSGKSKGDSNIEVGLRRAYNQRQDSGNPGKTCLPFLERPPMPLLISRKEV
jgi:hypothetical protein